MLRYETLFLTVPEVTSDEAHSLERQIDKTVNEAKGSIISYERWGKYHLAYPIRGYDYGVYFLVRFEVNDERKEELLNALKILFSVKYIDLVMRDLTTRLASQGSLDYKRPESLEETPSKDIDTFLKESKNILNTGSSMPSHAAEEEVQHEES